MKRNLFREPLVHFLLLGAGLFVLYAVLSDGEEQASNVIEIGAGDVDWIATTFERQWRRPPTEDEMRNLVESRLREEVLYREAIAMGLDRDDAIVRRRLAQKMEFLAEDIALMAAPPEAELRAYFQEHADRYNVPERRSFTHVYFSIDRRADAAEPAALRALDQLRASDPEEAPAELGDRFLLAAAQAERTEADVMGEFGEEFAATLFDAEPGSWEGPFESAYGLHVVRVSSVEPGHIPAFEAAKDDVVRDFEAGRRERANEIVFTELLKRYEVVIDEEAMASRTLKTVEARGN